MTEPIIKPISIESEKPVYETPLVMDLSKVQTGVGGSLCANGSADIFSCLAGAGVP